MHDLHQDVPRHVFIVAWGAEIINVGDKNMDEEASQGFFWRARSHKFVEDDACLGIVRFPAIRHGNIQAQTTVVKSVPTARWICPPNAAWTHAGARPQEPGKR